MNRPINIHSGHSVNSRMTVIK